MTMTWSWSALFLSASLFGTVQGLSSSPALDTSSAALAVPLDEGIFASPPPACADVLVAGGGLGGLATCLGLRNRGIDAHVIEASPTLLRGSTGTGIMISPNGFSALDSIAARGNENLSEAMRNVGAKISKQRIRVTERGTGRVDREFTMGGLSDRYGVDQYNVGWARAHEVLARAVPAEAVRSRSSMRRNKIRSYCALLYQGKCLVTSDLLPNLFLHPKQVRGRCSVTVVHSPFCWQSLFAWTTCLLSLSNAKKMMCFSPATISLSVALLTRVVMM